MFMFWLGEAASETSEKASAAMGETPSP